MTKKASDRGCGFTPGGWKFVAVVYAFVTFLDNLGEAHSAWTWVLAIVSAMSFVFLFVIGHRRSPRSLWSAPAATPQREGEDG